MKKIFATSLLLLFSGAAFVACDDNKNDDPTPQYDVISFEPAEHMAAVGGKEVSVGDVTLNIWNLGGDYTYKNAFCGASCLTELFDGDLFTSADGTVKFASYYDPQYSMWGGIAVAAAPDMTVSEQPIAQQFSVWAEGGANNTATYAVCYDSNTPTEAYPDYLTASGYPTITFSQLKSAFPDVSEMTLRTDLKSLDEARRIVRTHGGARSVEYIVGTDDLLLNRNTRNVAEKGIIARKAKGLIRPDSTVFLDSGSTTTALAKELDDMRTLVFTNSLTCAAELARLEQARTIMIGGSLNRYSLSLNGSKSIEDVNALSFDLLFLGVTSFQSSTGFACGSDDEAALKRALIAHAEKTVVLMDSSKLGQKSTFKICDLADVDYVVSDGKLTEHFKKYCEEAEVKVL